MKQNVDGKGFSKDTPRIPNHGGRSKPKRNFGSRVHVELLAPIIPSDGNPVMLPNWLNGLSDIRRDMVLKAAENERRRQNRIRTLRATLTRRGILRPAR